LGRGSGEYANSGGEGLGRERVGTERGESDYGTVYQRGKGCKVYQLFSRVGGRGPRESKIVGGPVQVKKRLGGANFKASQAESGERGALCSCARGPNVENT